MSGPELSVVVASHERPLRLRWLLNALEDQTLDRGRWEVVVCHDSRGPETERLLAEHPLAAAGVLRHTRLPPASAPPGANRNAALALARAAIVVFTDDDCRPPADWLEKASRAAREHPGAVIQGPVLPDPDEAAMLRSSHPRSQQFTDVPRPWAECANIVYPRALIERLGGFEEDVLTGEDADLAARARAAGAAIVGAAEMLTYHAVEEGNALDAAAGAWRWGDLARLIARHPELRDELYLRIFWMPAHAWLLPALGGLIRARRQPAWAALALPWALRHRSGRDDVRGLVRDLLELPGWALVDLAELTALARGSVRHRALIL